jgi:hypothetical protein
MSTKRNDVGDGWSPSTRVAAGAAALAVVAIGCVGFALGLRLDLGAVSLVGNALFVALGVLLGYAAATEATPTALELDTSLLEPNRVGEIGFAFDFEEETA